MVKYPQLSEALFIPKEDIKDEERIGEVPEQGYVWRD